MSKNHFLLLPLAAFAGASCAQSSLTLFGIADLTIARGTGSVADRTQLLRGGLNSNRLGFRGVEDLGGGTSASFWLEAGLNMDDGSGQATNSNNQASGGPAASLGGAQGLTFNRRSTVSLGNTSWGEIRLGRDYVPQYWNQVYGDPFGNVGVGATISYTANISGVANTRASNMVSYFTPNGLGGFAVHLSHYLGENASNAANTRDGKGNGVRLSYEQGPLLLSAAWGRTEYVTSDMTQRNVNAAYNFGVVKLMGTLNRDTTAPVTAKGGVLGGIAPVGVGSIVASYSWYELDSAGHQQTRKIALGYVHNLSKRTALYTTYAHNSNKGGASQALNGGVTAPNGSSSGLDLGIRHSF